MAIDPDLQSILNSNSVDGDHTFIDLDTIRDSKTGKKYRLAGFDAPEITKILGTNPDGTPNISGGTAGGANSVDIMELARSQGFTNVVKEEDGAAHGRGVARLLNDKGEDFATRLLEAGVTGLTPQSTRRQEEAVEVARLFGDSIVKQGDTEFKQAGEDLLNSMLKEGYDRLNFKRAATNEAEYASAPELFSSNVQFRSHDRDLKNNATSPWSDSFDTALIGITEAGYGIADMLGDTYGSEMLSSLGEQGSARARARIMEKGRVLTDWKDVNGFGTAVDFLTNNLAMSIPYMAITAASAAAAPITGGASLAVPASIYAGQIYNEQEPGKKDARYAIAGGIIQGALDMVGLKLATRSVGNTPKEFFDAGVAKLMNAEGLTKAMATEKLRTLSRRQIASLAKDGAELAKKQLTAKQMAKDMAISASQGAAGEAVTEALQEAIGYTAAHYDGSTFDFEELNDRMVAGAVAGGALGGAMSNMGTMYDKGAWADVAFRLAPADLKKQSQAGKIYDLEIQEHGGEEFVPTTFDIANEARINAQSSSQFESLKDRKEKHEKTEAAKGLTERALIKASRVGKLFFGHIDQAIPMDLMEKYKSLRKLGGMMGAGLQKVYSGDTVESMRHHVATRYINRLPEADKLYSLFPEYKKAFGNDNSQIGGQIYKDIESAMENGKFNPDLIPDSHPQKQTIVSLVNDLRHVGKKMWIDQRKFNPDLGFVQDYLLKRKSFDKAQIYKNKSKFIKLLTEIEDANISNKDAVELVDAILGNEQVTGFEEAFDIVEAGVKLGSHKKRSLGLSERKEFADFMEQNIMANVIDAAKSAARYQAHETFFGKDGEIINQLLDEAIAEGVPEDVVNRIASEMYDYIEAESGNYKRPTSEEGKKALEVQKNFIFLTTITSLTLATLSSLPELMITMKGLTVDQIFGKDKNSIKSKGEELAKDLAKIIKNESNEFDIDEYEAAKYRDSYGYQLAKDVGMFDQEIGAQAHTGITEVMPWKQSMLNTYFKAIGLAQYTDYTRALRASFAADFIFNHLNTIMANQGKPVTNEVQEAKEMLRNLGIDMRPSAISDLHEMLSQDPNSLSPEMQAELLERLRDPVYNFINEAIANPGTGNRPLFYQDPRFALFTQFQGFMSTFTANHIPKLWGEYIKRGSPAMKYNAFAVMTGMILMGFVSQYLKDLLKYGESTPYLTTAEKVRRGVFSSGLAGTYERIISTVAPIYETRSSNEAEWLYNEISGQSPAISKAGAAVGTAIDVVKGDVDGAGKGVMQLTSLPKSAVNKVSDVFTGWDFKGD